MTHLHSQTRIRIMTRIRIPNQTATLYHAEHFTLHGLRLGSPLPISVQDGNLSQNLSPAM